MFELHSCMQQFQKLNNAGNKPQLIRVSLVGNFEEITAFFGIGLKNTQKTMKQQKSTLFGKLILIFRKFLKKVSEE